MEVFLFYTGPSTGQDMDRHCQVGRMWEVYVPVGGTGIGREGLGFRLWPSVSYLHSPFTGH